MQPLATLHFRTELIAEILYVDYNRKIEFLLVETKAQHPRYVNGLICWETWPTKI